MGREEKRNGISKPSPSLENEEQKRIFIVRKSINKKGLIKKENQTQFIKNKLRNTAVQKFTRFTEPVRDQFKVLKIH